MALGTGIVIVAVLLILAWQLDKRGAWKKAGRNVLWCVLAIAVLIGAVVAYNYWDEWYEERANAKELASEGIDSYLGVRLGMNKNEVKYLLGEPISSRPGKSDSPTSEILSYGQVSEGIRKAIALDLSGNVRLIACAAEYSYECPALAGISIGDDEESITNSLGPPREVPVINEYSSKSIEYGPPSARVEFTLKKGVVRYLIVARRKPTESQ